MRAEADQHQLGIATFIFANVTIGTLMLCSARDVLRHALGRPQGMSTRSASEAPRPTVHTDNLAS